MAPMETPDQTITEAVAEILAQADAEIAAKRPVCRASGRCCKFETYGHRLYVTAAELAHFAGTYQPSESIETPESKTSNPRALALEQFFAQPAPEGCPYQIDNLCTAREARPLGCRVYFCDENAQSWQNDLYEKYHAQLRALHDRFSLPYRYLEWRTALRELGGF